MKDTKIIKKSWRAKTIWTDQWGHLRGRLGCCQVELKRWQVKKRVDSAEEKN